MSIIGYARVSTRDQTTALQIDALAKIPCDRVFEEAASGAQRDRPQLKAALEYLRPGDTLVVWKLDRLARSLKQLIETIELLDQRQVGFRSLTESIDTTTPTGRLIFQIFGALAEFERGLIRERTQAGLASARAQGRLSGRPLKMTEKDINAAKALLAGTDLTVDEAARRIGVSASTLYRHLPSARAVARGEA
ncbi:DNA invertase Pin-like site-specific DNA recombinase [Rhodoblastus acidophilus]|uniref:recombinase family protein n=1 Tax=Rhodoblastus acidophilus TaxID=1074 RepID=UPI002225A6F6|nr:recombinase family protein [Rhodoblastus acidophilus]MCW2283795.1 DNA invertase Pin-like site-specific DNA recombinase [Rhodoblastus acidophilus]MCW2332856.1 DNA invertase Pin-like site-specific DNA recombinase [Rhodoblastus acidophilus]